MSKRRSGWALCVLLLVMAFAFSACSSSKSDQSSGEAPKSVPNADMGGAKPAAEADSAFVVSEMAAAAPSASVENAGGGSEVGEGGGIGPIADPDTGMNRKVIYKANVTMKVTEFGPAEEKLRDAIHQSGSYILQFSNNMDAHEKGATYVIKVPADGFSRFIDQLRKIHKDMQLQMEGSDVTEEYVDLESRLEAKKTVEARLLSFLEKATKTDDLVRFSNDLAGIQEQIEKIKGRMRYLDQNVAYSTVNVRLYEGVAEIEANEEEVSGFGTKIVDTMTGSAKVMGELGRALILFLAGLLPVAAVAAVVGIPVWLILRDRRKHRRNISANRRKEWNSRSDEDETGLNAEEGKPDPVSFLEPQEDSGKPNPEEELR